MAKKRRVTRDRETVDPSPSQSVRSPLANPNGLLGQFNIAALGPGVLGPGVLGVGMLAGLLVYVTYHPSDSVAVEQGDALWLALFALITATISFSGLCWRQPRPFGQRSDWLIDVVAWSLALWMMLAAFSTAPPGNLRLATNEAWLWITGAAVFSTARRLLLPLVVRRAMLTLMFACGCGLAVHGLHQDHVSLPQTRAEYHANPDKMLKEIGMVAPKGSAARMVFENRLLDGGPSATFALANSLAGVLLIGCVIAVGMILSRWPSSRTWQKAAWLFALAVMLACLWAARSRSATAACIIGIAATTLGAITLRRGSDTSQDSVSSSVARLGLIGAAVAITLGAIVLGLIATIGKREWMEQAPASIMVRLQYWRSTWELSLDRPLFGCGPGNFQSIYQRYRAESSSEQIADPHNWFFETLASGGFIAAGLLVVLCCLCAKRVYDLHRQRLSPDVTGTDESTPAGRPFAIDSAAIVSTSVWVFGGAGVTLFLVWLIGFASGSVPDYDAHAYAVPIALVAGGLFWTGAKCLREVSVDLICATALAALLVHLMAAGGWTVPGVAMYVWLLCGQLTRVDQAGDKSAGKATELATGPRGTNGDSNVSSRKRNALIVFAVGVALAFGLRWLSLDPVSKRVMAMREADYARSLDQVRASDNAMRRAVEADDWAFEPSLYRADGLHWQVIMLDSFSPESTPTKTWLSELDRAVQRAGDNPSVRRAAGLQCLHVYQRWEHEPHLIQAQTLLEQAAEGNPADQWIAAQLSAIAVRRGNSTAAGNWLKKAEYLAGLADNPERILWRQMIYRVEHVGRQAEQGPVLFMASDLAQ